MKTNNIFEKIISWEELEKEEYIELAENSENKKLKEKILKMEITNWLSFEEKCKIVKNLVSEKTADLLKKEIIESKITEEQANFSMPENVHEDIKNIKIFLEIFWAKNINIKEWNTESWVGYWWDNCSSTTPTTIKFNY